MVSFGPAKYQILQMPQAGSGQTSARRISEGDKDKILKLESVVSADIDPPHLPGPMVSESTNDDMLHEMHRQLKAASRIMINLKSKVEDLTKRNEVLADSEQNLKQKLSDLEKWKLQHEDPASSIIEERDLLRSELKQLKEAEQAFKSTMNAQENPDGLTGVLEANRKVKLAQDQMAKLIARHRREFQDWILKSEKLEKSIQIDKVGQSQEIF